MSYQDFLASKSQSESYGFEPIWIPDWLFDFQASLVEWNLRKGRGALLVDAGLGKTPMQLVWSENVVRKTNKPVLILTPLAVGAQTLREAEKFGIEAKRSRDGKAHRCITIANYEILHKFNPDEFSGVVCDESAILKSFDGVTSAAIKEFMRRVDYRALLSAMPSPNDVIELGTSSEALGYLGHMDMLNRFFRNEMNNGSTSRGWAGQGGGAPKWRFKGHARQHFWRWVCSWARAARRPSDVGPFDDSRFDLPELIEREHLVEARTLAHGMLFPVEAIGLDEQREEARRTIVERCEKVAELVNGTGKPSACWCNLNPEGDLLAKLIPDALQVSGNDSLEAKEEKFLAFSSGQLRVVVLKKKIGAWGLNWQHCDHAAVFPDNSYEALYQLERRFWRYGQINPVLIDLVVTHSGATILRNLQRKAKQADLMFSELVAHMNDSLRIDRSVPFDKLAEVPAWLAS